MKRLTIKSTGGVGYALDLDDPQNEQEARKQLMDKFKIAVSKLAEFENFMEENDFESVEELRNEMDSLKAGYDYIYEQGGETIKDLIAELEDYKKAWGKLAKFVRVAARYFGGESDVLIIIPEQIMDKMRELEPKGGDDA